MEKITDVEEFLLEEGFEKIPCKCLFNFYQKKGTGESYRVYPESLGSKVEFYIDDKLVTKTAEYILVADRLYKHMNPESKMDTPNMIYSMTEKWYREWQTTETDLELFEWIIINKQ